MKQKEVIDNILFAYQNKTGMVFSENEVRRYIESVDFLQDVLRFNKTAILIVEYETLTYLYCSSNIAEVLGHSPEALMFQGPSLALSRIAAEDLKFYNSIIPDALIFFSNLSQAERNRHRFSFTIHVHHPDGAEVCLLQNNFFLKWGENGKPLIKLITLTDISAYKENKDVLFYITRLHEDGKSDMVLQKNLSNPAAESLTARELEIIHFLASGLSARDIARKISLSEDTIKNHKKNIMKKLGCTNSAHMVTLARLCGLNHTNVEIKG